nr:secreted RxLR effector protein 78-like [Ziziphus jujuba var. spinosa]
MVIKLDLRKDYDRLEWQFVIEALRLWGFSREFRELIFSCIGSVNYKVCINGNIVGNIDPVRGLRQGDPLSPYFFILCSEIFSKLMDRESGIQGIKIYRNAPVVSHLLYADDLLITYRANKENAKAILKCLKTYCNWLGQQIN